MKVLIATEKPFAENALKAIKAEIEQAGHQPVVLEKYTEQQSLLRRN